MKKDSYIKNLFQRLYIMTISHVMILEINVIQHKNQPPHWAVSVRDAVQGDDKSCVAFPHPKFHCCIWVLAGHVCACSFSHLYMGVHERTLSTAKVADAVRARSPQQQGPHSPLGKGALPSPRLKLVCWEGAGGHAQEPKGVGQAQKVPTCPTSHCYHLDIAW